MDPLGGDILQIVMAHKEKNIGLSWTGFKFKIKFQLELNPVEQNFRILTCLESQSGMMAAILLMALVLLRQVVVVCRVSIY